MFWKKTNKPVPSFGSHDDDMLGAEGHVALPDVKSGQYLGGPSIQTSVSAQRSSRAAFDALPPSPEMLEASTHYQLEDFGTNKVVPPGFVASRVSSTPHTPLPEGFEPHTIWAHYNKTLD